MPWNLVEMCITKSSSSCKNLIFIWLLDYYQISNLSSLLHAENYCIMADKMYSKIIAFLVQFPWNFYRISYHKSRACIQNFKPIQIDLVIQTQTWSLLDQIFNFGQISIHELFFIKGESNLKLICLNTFTRHISI